MNHRNKSMILITDFFYRVSFLDFDGWSLMSTLDLNFNPNIDDSKRKEERGKNLWEGFFSLDSKKLLLFVGYLRLLSGDMKHITSIVNRQSAFFPETNVDLSWEKTNDQKHFHLSFPFYPFRTLCPRDSHMIFNKNLEYDSASPLIPANTSIDISFKKRHKNNFLPFMIPYNLDVNLGSSKDSLTADEKKIATSFSVGSEATRKTYIITKIEINVKDIYLQV